MGMKFTIAGGKPLEKIELIALDLDGTALTPDNTVADATRAAVQRAREHSLRTLAFYEIAAKTGSEETAKEVYLARYGEGEP